MIENQLIKIGCDDYLMKFGSESFNELLKEAWDINPVDSWEDYFYSCLVRLSGSNEVKTNRKHVRELLKKKLKRFNKKELEDGRKEISIKFINRCLSLFSTSPRFKTGGIIKQFEPSENIRLHAELAEEYINDQKGLLIYTNQWFYAFHKGVWDRDEDQDIMTELAQMISLDHTNITEIERALKLIKTKLNPGKDFMFNDNPYKLNFKNGVFCLESNTFIKHSYTDYQTIQFPYDYNPNARCDRFVSFLKELEFDEGTMEFIRQWIGYCLFPAVKLQKALFLYGEGANGKSVLLEIIAALLFHVSYLELSEMFDKFKIAALDGKLANICTDIKSEKVIDSRFKKIVAGEMQTVELKHKNPYDIRVTAKIMFSANNFPISRDTSHGFFRRFIVLPFTRIFSESEQDPELKNDIIKNELSGILNWALEGLKVLIENEWKFALSPSIIDAEKEFRYNADPLSVFVDEECKLGSDFSIPTKDFRKSYVNWCRENGYKALAMIQLGKQLVKWSIDKKRHGSKVHRRYYYVGIDILHKP
jgi:putative DNA primase/helicase